MEKANKRNEPQSIFDQYQKQVNYKAAMGDNGMYEQNRINERFYIGDQWSGANCGSQKPLVRYNIIKRIGDYKMAMAAGSAVSVQFGVEGVPYTTEQKEQVRRLKENYRQKSNGIAMEEQPSEEEEINLIMEALGEYFKTTAERVKLEDKKNLVLRKAYTSGTGILYTYWDSSVRTGLYADERKMSPIKGDIQCEVLDVENVYFGDPHETDVEKQPYILIAQRKTVEELKREAIRCHRPRTDIDAIRPDDDSRYMAGAVQDDALTNLQKATVLTKLYKRWEENGTDYTIRAVRVTKTATIREEWDIGVRRYPLAVISWESAPNCIYGVSEVTNLVPNQIAINRAVTASANAVMTMGMPKMLVNMDSVSTPVTNDPGQIIPIYGDLDNCIRYVAPQNFTPQFNDLVNSMLSNTLAQAGANEAALGDVRPDNTSAIIAVREAATLPMQLLQNRFYSFIEDVARIWAEFWVRMYGARKLKIRDVKGEWYIPFDGSKYRDRVITARVDVGPANMYSEIQSRQTLDNLYKNGIISAWQYLVRLPKGSVPEQSALIREMREQTDREKAPLSPRETIENLSPEYRKKFAALTADDQAAVLKSLE